MIFFEYDWPIFVKFAANAFGNGMKTKESKSILVQMQIVLFIHHLTIA